MMMMVQRVLIFLALFYISRTEGYFISVDAQAEECFFDKVTQGVKMSLTFQVVEGGFLDIDVAVTGPDGRTIYSEKQETMQTFTFAAHMDGEYRYCFSNVKSSQTPKVVMFNMDIGELPRHAAPSSPEEENAEHQKLEGMVRELAQSLHGVKREQEYMTRRERIHREINQNTNSRVVMWAFFEAAVLVIMTVSQVYYLKRFFEVRRVV